MVIVYSSMSIYISNIRKYDSYKHKFKLNYALVQIGELTTSPWVTDHTALYRKNKWKLLLIEKFEFFFF